MNSFFRFKSESKSRSIWSTFLVLQLFLVATTRSQQSSNHLISQYQQHNNILHFVVPEDAPNNTHVGQIISSDGQRPYLVLPSPQTPEQERTAALTINLNNGDLITNGALDREHRDQYHFVAIVKEPFAEIKCTVTVQDVNDNAPMFLLHNSSDANFVIDFPEEWPVEKPPLRKSLPLAIDLDTPQFGLKEFRLISGNTPSGLFQLVEFGAPVNRSSQLAAQKQNQLDQDPTSSMLNGHHQSFSGANQNILDQLAQQASVLIPSQPALSSHVQPLIHPQAASMVPIVASAALNPQNKYQIELVALEPLDREKQSSYQLTVEAIDGGQPPLLGRLMITINVQDVNDNSPKFLHEAYETHTREDTAVGTLLYRLQAHDKDAGSNAQISYYIISQARSSSQMNNNQSNSSDKQADQSRFVVNQAQNISNNNNNNNNKQQKPTVSQSSGNKQRTQQTSDVYDPSKQQKDCNSDQLFEIDPIKGEVYLSCSLDYETQQMHELLIEARDHGQPSRSGFTKLKVYVTDVNDDPPANPNVNRLYDSNVSADKRGQLQPMNLQQLSSEASRSDGTRANDPTAFDATYSNGVGSSNLMQIQNLNLPAWFAQVNSSLLFVIVLVALFAIAFPVCLVKIKSSQPESDTAGLTLSPNGHQNGQSTKHSPNHSSSSAISNERASMMQTHLHPFSHSHHHDHVASSIPRRSSHQNGGSFAGLSALANSGHQNLHLSHQHQYVDSSNLYHNPYSQRHSTSSSSRLLCNQQIAPTSSGHVHPGSGDSPNQHDGFASNNLGGSAENAMTILHNIVQSQHLSPQQHGDHAHHPALGSDQFHLSLENHQFPVHSSPANQGHHTSSLTYAHHRNRQQHHHKSGQQLPPAGSLPHSANFHQLIHHTNSNTISNIRCLTSASNNFTPSAINTIGNPNEGGTMNSINTHLSAASPSALQATSNVTHSSALPGNLYPNHEVHQQHSFPTHLANSMHHLPNIPYINECFHHQQPHSGVNCGQCTGGTLNSQTRDNMNCQIDDFCLSSITQPALDRSSDPSGTPNLESSQDWFSSYNWDYLEDWKPECQSLMSLLLTEPLRLN